MRTRNPNECNACNVKSEVCGQAFTDYKCHGCKKTFSWHNTCTPVYCVTCSAKLNRCMRCGIKMTNNVMKPTTKNVLYMLRESNAIEGVYGRSSLIYAHQAWKHLIEHDIMTPTLIKEAHQILMQFHISEIKYIGNWRDVPVYIGGEAKTQPYVVIDQQIRDWCDKTNKVDRNYDPVSLHIEFEGIHPFIDGNGRIGRMLLNWHLVKKNGAQLLIYTADDRQTYYRLFPSYRRAEMQRIFSAMKIVNAKNL